ncbi:MAG: MCE family protein [Candidatus Cloacimonetes bacterium]|nr:MCE family protein [Candidatus Cloacimonadota bacterium]
MKRFYPDIRSTQLKVGIFTVLILAILALGYLWLSSRISSQSQRDLRISFEDVMGLEIGDQVTFRGMEVGRVKKIEAREHGILVTTRINTDIILREGSRYIISDSSLMGGSVLNITQGTGPAAVNTRQVLRGESPVGIMGAVNRATLAIDEINTAFSSLNADGGMIGKSSALLDNARQAAVSLDELALTAQSDLRAALRQIELLSGELLAVAQNAAPKLDSALEQAPGAMASVSATLDSLRTLSSHLEQTVTALNSGNSTAGRLLRDDELYLRLQTSVASLDSLLQEVRANPGKYLKFSIF